MSLHAVVLQNQEKQNPLPEYWCSWTQRQQLREDPVECVNVGAKELACPAQSPEHLNPKEHPWDNVELDWSLIKIPSAPKLTDAP